MTAATSVPSVWIATPCQNVSLFIHRVSHQVDVSRSTRTLSLAGRSTPGSGAPPDPNCVTSHSRVLLAVYQACDVLGIQVSFRRFASTPCIKLEMAQIPVAAGRIVTWGPATGHVPG